jgi:hypothetical protein
MNLDIWEQRKEFFVNFFAFLAVFAVKKVFAVASRYRIKKTPLSRLRERGWG